MSDSFSITAPVIEKVNDPFLSAYDANLSILRLDKIHDSVNGNKWFKLQLNLDAAKYHSTDTVLSFGGAYSNHIRALAAATQSLGMRSIGVIRGELVTPLNPALEFARRNGMLLHPVSRSDYRLKNTPQFLYGLRQLFGDFYLVPEGGSNELGVQGCEQLSNYLSPWLDSSGADTHRYVAVACGTGATLAGLLRGVARNRLALKLLGVAVLKGAHFLNDDVRHWLQEVEVADQLDWQIALDYHFGGYARQDRELLEFIARFTDVTAIPLEPVYTGKMLFGVYDLIRKGSIPRGSHVLAIHTGGLPVPSV